VSHFYYFTDRIEIIKEVKFVHVINFIKVRKFSPNVKLHVQNNCGLSCLGLVLSTWQLIG